MKFLPIIVGVIAVVLLLIGHLVQSLSVLSYIGTLLIIVLVIILARGLTAWSSARVCATMCAVDIEEKS